MDGWSGWDFQRFYLLLAAAGVVAALSRDGWLGWAVLIVFVVGVVDGLVGVYEHVRGVAGRIGGFSLRNLVAGPPVLLPVMFTALAFSGGLAVLWGGLRKSSRPSGRVRGRRS